MKEADMDSNSVYTSYFKRMSKLNDNELRREYVSVMAYPKGTKNDDILKMKAQMLQVIAKERSILL